MVKSTFFLVCMMQAGALTDQPTIVSEAETSSPTETSAEQPTPGEPTEAEDIVVTGEPDDDDKLICRTEKKIGTNIKKKVCRTAREVRLEAEAAKAFARDLSTHQNHSQAAAAKNQ